MPRCCKVWQAGISEKSSACRETKPEAAMMLRARKLVTMVGAPGSAIAMNAEAEAGRREKQRTHRQWKREKQREQRRSKKKSKRLVFATLPQRFYAARNPRPMRLCHALEAKWCANRKWQHFSTEPWGPWGFWGPCGPLGALGRSISRLSSLQRSHLRTALNIFEGAWTSPCHDVHDPDIHTFHIYSMPDIHAAIWPWLWIFR